MNKRALIEKALRDLDRSGTPLTGRPPTRAGTQVAQLGEHAQPAHAETPVDARNDALQDVASATPSHDAQEATAHPRFRPRAAAAGIAAWTQSHLPQAAAPQSPSTTGASPPVASREATTATDAAPLASHATSMAQAPEAMPERDAARDAMVAAPHSQPPLDFNADEVNAYGDPVHARMSGGDDASPWTPEAHRKGVRSGKRSALLWGIAGFVLGAAFWHAVGFWDFVNTAMLGRPPAQHTVDLGAVSQANAGRPPPKRINERVGPEGPLTSAKATALTPRNGLPCTTLTIDRASGNTRAAACGSPPPTANARPAARGDRGLLAPKRPVPASSSEKPALKGLKVPQPRPATPPRWTATTRPGTR
ncbi:MAG: hypothetical protein AAFR04_00965 [Pseudomonadota bacterium]